MNNISLAKFDKKEWVVRTPLYNRYKIYNHKKRRKGQKTPVNRGQVCMAFDYGNKLYLSYLKYGRNEGAFRKIEEVRYCLKMVNGRVVVYSIQNTANNKRVRNSSNNPSSIQANLIPGQVGTNSNGKKNKIFNKRLNSVFINFLKRNGLTGDKNKDFARNLFGACFPAVAEVELKHYSVSSVYSRHLFNGDIKTVIKKCFGYDSKKLVKSVCELIEKEKSLTPLLLGVPFKKELPVDYYYDLLENRVDKSLSGLFSRISFQQKRPVTLLRGVLKYDKKRILSFLKGIKEGDYYVRDAIDVFSQRKNEQGFSLPKKPKDWKELHDAIAINRPHRRHIDWCEPTKPKVNHILPVRDKYKLIDGVVYEGFRFEIPKDSDTLVEYSNKMSNCIRWYAQQVINNTCNLIGVYSNNELKYNISIENNEIQQFYGKYNGQPDAQDREKIVQFLEDNKICRKSFKIKDIVGNTFLEERGFTDQELAMEV